MAPLSCFINNYYGFWKLTFSDQVKIMYEVGQGIYNIEMYFKHLLPA